MRGLSLPSKCTFITPCTLLYPLITSVKINLHFEQAKHCIHAVDFNSAEFNLPSGIYFYTLNAGEFK